MTDQNTPHGTELATSVNEVAEPGPEVSKGRRSMIKGAVGTLPMILTLQSGAALARSSNLIIAASPASAKDAYGRTLCMDESSVYPAAEAGMYDLGEPASGTVMAINDRKHMSWDGRRASYISEDEMCERGGTYYYAKRYGYGTVDCKGGGMLVSAGAISSFAGKIDIIDM